MNATEFNALLDNLKSINIKKIRDWKSLNYLVLRAIENAGLEDAFGQVAIETVSVQITNKLCITNKKFLKDVQSINNLQNVLNNYTVDGILKLKGFEAARPSDKDLDYFLVDVLLESTKLTIGEYRDEILRGLSSCDLKIEEFTDFINFVSETYNAIQNKKVADFVNVFPVDYNYVGIAKFVYNITRTLPTEKDFFVFEDSVIELAEKLYIKNSDELLDNLAFFYPLLSNCFDAFNDKNAMLAARNVEEYRQEFIEVLVDFINFEGIIEDLENEDIIEDLENEDED